jgi:hypothetical protein
MTFSGNMTSMGSNGGFGGTKIPLGGFMSGAGNFAQNYQAPKPVAPTNQAVKSHSVNITLQK